MWAGVERNVKWYSDDGKTNMLCFLAVCWRHSFSVDCGIGKILFGKSLPPDAKVLTGTEAQRYSRHKEPAYFLDRIDHLYIDTNSQA